MSLSKLGYSSMAIGAALDTALAQHLIQLVDGEGWHLTEDGEFHLGQAKVSKEWILPLPQTGAQKFPEDHIYVPPKRVISRLSK